MPEDRIVVIHANLFSFGYLDDIAYAFMQAIDEALGPDRTLLMPTFSFAFFKERRFHHRDSKSEMGVLSEYFRTLPGVDRTPCPVNSFAVRGPQSALFLDRPSGDSFWGAGSVFETLSRRDALVIGLGEPLAKSASIFHHAEERVGVPYRYFKTLTGKADFGAGPEDVRRRFYVRRVDLPVSYAYDAPVEFLRGRAKIREARLGVSTVEAVRAGDAVKCLTAMLTDDPLALLTNREEYEAAAARKVFCFLGSSNLDPTSHVFAAEHKALLQSEPRVLRLPFGQGTQQILDPESDLRVVDPHYVVFLERAEDLLGDLLHATSAPVEVDATVADAVDRYAALLRRARAALSGRFLVANFESALPSPWGGADPQFSWGHRRVIALANARLAECLAELPDTHILDYQGLLLGHGARASNGRKYWYLGRIPFSQPFSTALARVVIGLSLAAEGRTARLVVLDLDNTLWGGVVGDDGMAGLRLGGDFPGNLFREWQRFLKSLTVRGIALAVCSKNDPEVALEAIETHPDMVLRRGDFAALRINWQDKAENILAICRELGLGPASVMLLDDNPVERERVRRGIPECIVPELPADVSQWIPFLAESPFLQALRVTDEDLMRTRQYTQMAKMRESAAGFDDVDDFLRTLDMRVELFPYDATNKARILQLIAKTNQFNATTRRYTEADLERLVSDRQARVLAISLEDRFIKKEIVGVAIVVPDGATCRIDSFILSCRVLGRGIEHAVLEWIVDRARQEHYAAVLGEVVPTTRNTPVRSLYVDYGFEPLAEPWFRLDLVDAAGYRVPDFIRVRYAGS